MSNHTADTPQDPPNISNLSINEDDPTINSETVQESHNDVEWRSHQSHLLVLTNAGKPLLTLHGDEAKLAGVMAVAQALISVVKDMDGDALRIVRAHHQLTMAFLERGPLYFVAAGHGRAAEPAMLELMLDMVHKQIQVLLTNAMEKMVERNPRYDARSLLRGISPLVTSLTSWCQQQPFLALDATPSLPLSPSVRRLLLDHLHTLIHTTPTALYALLLSNDGSCVASVHARNTGALPPRDVLLLINFVWATESFRTGEEAVTPVCLPCVHPEGFFHAYIRFIDTAQRLPLVLIGTSTDIIETASTAAASLVDTMTQSGMLQALVQACNTHQDPPQHEPPTSTTRPCVIHPDPAIPPCWAPAGQLPLHSIPQQAGGGVLGTTPLLHMAYRHNALQQAVCSVMDDALVSSGVQEEIMAWYLRIRTRLQATRPGVPPHRCYTFRGPQWLMVVQMNDAHELYMTCDPLTTLEAATELAARLLSWAKSQLPVLFSPAS